MFLPTTNSFFSSVQFSHSVVSDSTKPHGLQHARPPCPSPTPGAYSNSCPSSWWCHPTISSSVVPFCSCLQSFTASGSVPRSQFFSSHGQSIGVSAWASVLPVNIQDWFPLGWTGLIFLWSKGLSRVFLNTTVQNHQFFGARLSLWASLVAQRLKCLPAMWETWVRSLGQEDPLEKEMATHSSILAWEIHGWRSLVAYSPWGRKELDTTEQLHYTTLSL